MMSTIIETARLSLREMSLGDLDFVSSMLGDPQVMRFYPKCYSRDDSADWIRRQMDRYERDGHGLWLVRDRVSQEPIGQVGLLIQDVAGFAEREVGYLIHHPHWRRGFASEAATATRDHAFGVLGVDRVISLIRPENLPSQGVARKMGMLPEGGALHAGLEHLVFATSRASESHTS
jgi:RimJ/RimL family protein N-acetyltransferase